MGCQNLQSFLILARISSADSRSASGLGLMLMRASTTRSQPTGGGSVRADRPGEGALSGPGGQAGPKGDAGLLEVV